MSYLYLKENLQMRKEGNKAILFDNRIEKIGAKLFEIPLNDFYVLQLFNGQLTKSDLVSVLARRKGLKDKYIDYGITEFIKEYSDYIAESPCKFKRDDLVIERKQNYSEKCLYTSRARLSTPLFVSLVLTENCFVKCKYCFADGSSGNRNGLSTSDIFAIIDECKELGVASLNLTGGDPFTRDDIYEILEYLNKKKLRYSVSTKKVLKPNDVERLRDVGLKEIQVSIDSNCDKVCEELIGARGYYSAIKNSIKELVEVGINVKTNTVITKLNIETIPALAEELLEEGVSKIYLSPYLNSLGRHDDVFFCDEFLYKKLHDDLIDDDRIDFKSIDYSKTTKTLDDIQICTGGKMGFVIYSDGSAGICERLLKDRFNLGNVKDKSIIEIWQSTEMQRIVEPDRELFLESLCYACNDFDKCIKTKGVCYVRSMIQSGQLFTTDPLCPRVKVAERMF